MSTNRRDFLKKLGLAGAGAGLMPITSFASGSNEKISGTNEQKASGKFTVSILQLPMCIVRFIHMMNFSGKIIRLYSGKPVVTHI